MYLHNKLNANIGKRKQVRTHRDKKEVTHYNNITSLDTKTYSLIMRKPVIREVSPRETTWLSNHWITPNYPEYFNPTNSELFAW
uniref:Uncharacterized protein n=1 Tax=Candidatus Kentrum sp. SD TaxID=2126332 RepID=A0A451BSF1_9GAMM|nr:MAG: hypothetical protein BECKSD772D_GA0070982_12475 [Candidatus Kentron sp. SD]